jgi:mono/diheme cytochrome c family protein
VRGPKTLAVAAAALGALAIAGGQTVAQFPQRGPADPARGRVLAERLCASCHVVAPDATGVGLPGVPSFPAIAVHPGQTAERLAGKIIVPHPEMPAVSLTMAEIRDVVAYIQSLARR